MTASRQALLQHSRRVLVKIGTGNPQGPIELAYTVTNFLIAPGEGLPVRLTVGE